METQEVINVFNQKVTCIQGDYMTNEIITDGLYEFKIIKFVLDILEKMSQPVVLDIGANIGNHSLAFSTIAEKVYSFEPTPLTFSVLHKNVVNNNIKNIMTINKGVSDVEKNSLIHINTIGNLGSTSIEVDSPNSKSEEISLITVDGFVEESGIKKVDFIKMDIEGHEIHALKGMTKVISMFRPVVMMEWNYTSKAEDFTGNFAFECLFPDYDIFFIGYNYKYINGISNCKRIKKLHRSIYKRLHKERVLLLPFIFDDKGKEDNLLLVPKEKSKLIDKKYFLSHSKVF